MHEGVSYFSRCTVEGAGYDEGPKKGHSYLKD